MSSLLIEVRQVPHIHNGREYKPGELCRVPDDVALAKIKRGHANLADSKALVREREMKKERKALAEKAAKAEAEKKK